VNGRKVRIGMAEWAELAIEVGALLKEKEQTVAVAESSSGGMISAALLSVPGASAYFKGGGACYTSASKQTLMGISDAEMERERASTETHAIVLAKAAVEQLGADWGIGETGAAGPTGNRYGDKPGHCCVGVAGQVEKAKTIETGSENRPENMVAFTAAALELLKECLETQ
jgi:nicotinamide-nucleotide amidase